MNIEKLYSFIDARANNAKKLVDKCNKMIESSKIKLEKLSEDFDSINTKNVYGKTYTYKLRYDKDGGDMLQIKAINEHTLAVQITNDSENSFQKATSRFALPKGYNAFHWKKIYKKLTKTLYVSVPYEGVDNLSPEA